MTEKVHFFYANGTSYTLNIIELGFSVDNSGVIRIGNKVINPVTSKTNATVAGLDGRVATWDGTPAADPFPYLLNPDIWNPVRIAYPASMLGIGPSIDYCVNQVSKLIAALPPGSAYCVGGYSQGAAAMSQIYSLIKAGTLGTGRTFLGGVCFGNPRRQLNFRGSVGGTWSGYWDDPNRGTGSAATSGGHGSFPATGPYARLSGCDGTKWVEFTAPDDVFSGTGDTTKGTNWTNGNDVLLNLLQSQYAGALVSQAAASLIGINSPMLSAIGEAFALSGENLFVDSAGKPFGIGGAGHTSYPFVPPPNNSGVIPTTPLVVDGKTYLQPVGQTAYQVAMSFLDTKAKEWATAPVIIPPLSTGWSTTLVPPAS